MAVGKLKKKSWSSMTQSDTDLSDMNGTLVAPAHLRHGAALHLAQQRVEGVVDPVGAVAVVDEDIARRDKPRAVGETHLVHRGARHFKLTRSGK